MDQETNLQHHGVKGQKWGVRRDRQYSKGMKGRDVRKLKKITNESDRNKYLDDRDKKWLEKSKDSTKAQKVAKGTAKDMRKINKDLKKQYGSDLKRKFNRQLSAAYNRDLKSAYEDIISAHTNKVYGISPTRTREIEIQSTSGGGMKAVVVNRENPKLSKQRASIQKANNRAIKKEAKEKAKEKEQTIKHSSDPLAELDDMFFIIELDEDGFADNVISPTDFMDKTIGDLMTHSIKDIDNNILDNGNLLLVHHGIKGQKWGVRNDRRPSIKDHINSLKRERQWKNIVNNVNKLSTDEILTVSKRISLENDLKRLSRNRAITNQETKNNYTYREHLSDQDLQNKVHRLRAEESLYKNASSASKEQREIGQKVANAGKALAYTYAKNKTITAEDIFNTYKNPNKVKESAKSELTKRLFDKGSK